MSEPHEPHAAAATTYGDELSPSARFPRPKSTATVRFWAVPILLTLAVTSALAGFYLGGILQPMTNLRHFPIAVLNEDAGPTGAQVLKGMLAGFDHDAYDVRVLTHDQAKTQMDTAQVYGVAVIPPNFSSKLQAYARSALTPGRVERAVIVVSTNPRAGTLGANIAGQTLQRAVAMVDQRVGQRLSQEVAEQTGKAPEPGAVALMLANPVEVKSTVHNALPNGTGNGLSAFYYSLLLVLAGVIGSIVVSRSVDAMHPERSAVSPLRILFIKWSMVAALALLTSAAYLLIALQFGMPIQNSLTLWLFGVLAITAVGVGSTSLIVAFGSVGTLVSLFVFVILGLPSAGATVPLQATPALFEWQAKFEPMHQVFVGTRSLLYLGGQAGSGLVQSLECVTIDLVIGLLVGALAVRIHDRRGLGPRPAADPVTAPADPSGGVPYPER